MDANSIQIFHVPLALTEKPQIVVSVGNFTEGWQTATLNLKEARNVVDRLNKLIELLDGKEGFHNGGYISGFE
jgi:hypothetical protein